MQEKVTGPSRIFIPMRYPQVLLLQVYLDYLGFLCFPLGHLDGRTLLFGLLLAHVAPAFV
jgi:hypothetical protein